MKIRIKGNSIRLRLTKTDVQNLKYNGRIEEKTNLGNDEFFKYSLMTDHNTSQLSATYQNAEITVFISEKETEILTDSDAITIQGFQNNGEEKALFLLIEKDLQCLDATTEDQSDMYENAKTNC